MNLLAEKKEELVARLTDQQLPESQRSTRTTKQKPAKNQKKSTKETQAQATIQLNLATIVEIAYPVVVFDFKFVLSEAVNQDKRNRTKVKAKEYWNNYINTTSRKWAFTDFWNLAASIYDFIAQLIPNFFAVDESRQEILDFRSQITKLIAKYRPLYNSMLKISSSLADKVISLVSEQEKEKTLLDQVNEFQMEHPTAATILQEEISAHTDAPQPTKKKRN